jgi:HlyD family secretion protein/adhesin transport system membrane fusion protein
MSGRGILSPFVRLVVRKLPGKQVIAKAGGVERRRSEAQLRYLSNATFLEEVGSPKFLAGAVLTGCLCIAGLIGWCAVTEVTEVAHAPGEVVPTSFEQVVQHLDGGIIRSILVKQGDMVSKDQVLMIVDDGVTKENLARARAKLVFLELTAERLRAVYDTSMPNWNAVRGAAQNEIDAQEKLFRASLEEQAGREKIIIEQIEQKKTTSAMLKGQLDTARKSRDISEKILTARRQLHGQQLIAYPILARAEQDVLQVTGEVTRLTDRIKENSEALAELAHRLDAVRSGSRLETAAKLNDTLSEIQQHSSTISSLGTRFARFELRSPVRGVVKSLQVHTLGSILTAGQTVMTIVPVDDELVVEVQISPRDIGHVRVGQPVQVKFSAFDFTRFGVVRGRLDWISAGAFGGRSGEQFYRARVKLTADFIGGDRRANRIIPHAYAVSSGRRGRARFPGSAFSS